LAFLFPGIVRLPRRHGRPGARLVRPEALVDSGISAVLAGVADTALPRPLPIHLLLLPRRLLQVVLGGPARVRRRRATQEVPGGKLLPPDPPERSSLFHVGRGGLPGIPVVRRVAGA